MIQAMSGLMSVTGPKDGPPYRIPLAISDVGAGLYLTIGILAALQARQKTGQGQWVETSLLEATVSLGVYEAANYFANGIRPEKLALPYLAGEPSQHDVQVQPPAERQTNEEREQPLWRLDG